MYKGDVLSLLSNQASASIVIESYTVVEMPPGPAHVKKRSRLSDAQRKEICEYSQKNPSVKHHEIAKEFLKRYPSLTLDRSTITKTLTKRNQYLKLKITASAEKTYRHRPPKYPLVEMALNLWVDQVNATTGLVLTDALLKEKAHTFAEGLGIDKDAQNFTNGWLEKFKRRNNIRKFMLHGEASSAPLASLPEARTRLQAIISGYDLDDVYNVDETALFFRTIPNQTLGKKAKAGTKMVRVILLHIVINFFNINIYYFMLFRTSLD